MKHLYLNERDKKVAGLCAGVADYLEVDVTVVRLIALILIISSTVLPGLIAYFIAAAITPKQGESK